MGGEEGKRNKEDVKGEGEPTRDSLGNISRLFTVAAVSFSFSFGAVARDKLRFCDSDQRRSSEPQTCSTAVIF